MVSDIFVRAQCLARGLLIAAAATATVRKRPSDGIVIPRWAQAADA